MKKILIFGILILLSVGAMAQTRARTGLTVGDHKVPGTHIVKQDSTTTDANGKLTFFIGGSTDTASVHVNQSDLVVYTDIVVAKADSGTYNGGYITPTAGVLKADSTGNAAGNYMTRQNYQVDAENNHFFKVIDDYSLTGILAAPIGATSQGMSATSLTDNTALYAVFYLYKPMTITGIKTILDTQGNYTADQTNHVGLFSIDGTGINLVASSADNGNLWKNAAYSAMTIAFETPYVAAAGYYVVGLVYNSSAQTTAPKIWSWNNQNGTPWNYFLTGNYKYVFQKASTNSLATATWAAVSVGTVVPFVLLY